MEQKRYVNTNGTMDSDLSSNVHNRLHQQALVKQKAQ